MLSKKEEAKKCFKELMQEGEQLLWAEKPVLVPHLAIVAVVQVAGILWLLMDIEFILDSTHFSLFKFIFMIFHLTPFWSSCLFSWNSYERFQYIIYAYSEKSIFIRSGMGANYNVINFDEIILLESRANIIDDKYHVGSIIIHSGKEKTGVSKKINVLHSIPNPVETLGILRKMSKI